MTFQPPLPDGTVRVLLLSKEENFAWRNPKLEVLNVKLQTRSTKTETLNQCPVPKYFILHQSYFIFPNTQH
jgi:hypothetical protein